MLIGLFDRWPKSRSFAASELAVLKLFFPENSIYAQKLYSQATNAPFIQRRLIGSNGYEAIIPYVNDDSLLIECDQNIESPTITIPSLTGSVMKFSVGLLRGGFLRGLRGENEDGASWPREWKADIAHAQIPASISNWLPHLMNDEVKETILERLLLWCGLAKEQRATIFQNETLRLSEPATEAMIAKSEARVGTYFGQQYRELLAITDGFGIRQGRPYEFLGTRDVEFVNGGKAWLCITPLYEEGCVAVHCSNCLASNECYVLTGNEVPIHVGDVKQHVRESLLLW